MTIIQSEIFKNIINSSYFTINNEGPLHSPVSEVEIDRDKKLNIILTTTSMSNSSSKSIQHPPGTVRVNNDSISMKDDISGWDVKLNGVQPLKNTTTIDVHRNSVRKEVTSIDSLKGKIEGAADGKYLIEWLENVDDGYYIWPESVETCTVNDTTISLGYGANKIQMREKSESQKMGLSSIFVSIGGYELYLVSSREDNNYLGVKSGYLLYLGTPCDETRKKIRNCLSFILGRPLIKTGYSVFDINWKIISFNAISAYTMGGAAFSIHTSPPAPLGTQHQRVLDQKTISSLANSIYEKYEEYNFGTLSWSYWHAISAPIHIAAVHFGACIESLQNSYIKHHGKSFQSALLEKSQWSMFRNGMLGILNSIELEGVERQVIENKLNSFNHTPQNVLTARFLESLGISLSNAEKAAWQQRNDAAHGNEVEDGNQIKLIRDLKLLKVIFHRVFLSVIGGGSHYIDYYSIGFPNKLLTESCE